MDKEREISERERERLGLVCFKKKKFMYISRTLYMTNMFI